jgi:predicted nucleotidyltransferase
MRKHGIALIGSIVTAKPTPKDIDLLVTVTDDADLTSLATK